MQASPPTGRLVSVHPGSRDERSGHLRVSGTGMSDVLFSNERLLVRKGRTYSKRALLIAFDSYTDDRRLERRCFAEHLAERHAIDAVFVLSRDNDWYQYPEMPAALGTIRALAATYDRAVAYGSSMGGYAAIRMGRWAGADSAVAISPQYSVDPAICPWENRWSFDVERISFLWDRSYRDGVVDDAIIVFDPHNSDARHARLLEAVCRVRSIRIPHAGHPAGVYLAEVGILPELIEHALAGAVDTAAYELKARQGRERSVGYLLTVAQRLKRSHCAAKLDLLRRARALRPNDSGVESQGAQILQECGHSAEAEDGHRKALTLWPDNPVFLWRYSEYLEERDRLFDAVGVMSRLNALHSVRIYQERFAALYWRLAARLKTDEPAAAGPQPAWRQLLDRSGQWLFRRSNPPSPDGLSPPHDDAAMRRFLFQRQELLPPQSPPDMYLFGDSHAEFWPQEYWRRPVLNLGSAGDKTQSALWRLDRLGDLLAPRPVLVVLGANNLAGGETPDAILAGLTHVRDQLLACGAGPVLFLTLPPYGTSLGFDPPARALVNQAIAATLPSFDVEPVIRPLGGDAFWPDQIHLSARAYLAIVQALHRLAAVDTDFAPFRP